MGLRISEAKAKRLGIPFDVPSSIRRPIRVRVHIPGRVQTLDIPDWQPATVNQLLRTVRGRIALKKRDREKIDYARCFHGTDRAGGPRRLTLTIVLGPRQRGADSDAYWKSLLDAMKHAGLIVDDTAAYATLEPIRFDKAKYKATRIELTDL